MRVLLVHTRYLQAGGEDIVFQSEAVLLADAGHDVHTFEASNEPLRDMNGVKAAGLSLWNEGMRLQLREKVRRTRPDVVHFHNTFPFLSPSSYYALRRGAAVVQTLHNYRLICPAAVLFRRGESCEECVGHFPWAGIAHGCYRDSRAATAAVGAVVQAHRAAGTWRRVNAFVALTEHARELFVRGGLPADRIFVKPNFIHPDPGAGLHRGDCYLFVGRLDKQKGIDTLLEAWSRLPDVKLRVIGDGPLAERVADVCAQNDNIEFTGPLSREHVLEQMSNARALVFPSLSHENCPLTILEAFATGLPVLASGTGNIAALVGQGDCGWTYEPGNARELTGAVAHIERHPGERVRKGTNARLRFQRDFTAEASRQQLESIYETALKKVHAA